MRRVDASQRDLIRDVVNEGLSPYSVSALEKDLHLSVILERLNSFRSELPELILARGISWSLAFTQGSGRLDAF